MERSDTTVAREQLGGVFCAVTVVELFSFIPYVDWAAHLGGLIAGFLVGIVCFSFWISNRFFIVFWFFLGTFLTVVVFTLAIDYMYSVLWGLSQI